VYLHRTLRPTASRRLGAIPRAAWAIIAAALPAHLVLALSTDLSPDEAYYLCAARQPGVWPSLVDHPPLVPWLLALSDAAPMAVELRVRVWAIAFAFATSAACVELARRRGASERGCVLAAWLSTWALLPMAGGFVMTPDGPALLAMLVALIFIDQEGRSPLAAVGAALALFLGALSKVVVVPIALLMAVANGPGRARSRIGLALGPLLALPLLLPSLRFQLHHAFTQTALSGWSAALAVGALLAAVSAQVGLWTPLVVWHGLRRLGRMPRIDRAVTLGLSALVLLSALVRAVPPEPNWWAPAALVVVVTCARFADHLAFRARAAILVMVLVPAAIAAAHTIHPFLPLPARADPTARLHGWSEGREPVEAAGVGQYGPVAERCVYLSECKEIVKYFKEMQPHD